METLEAMRKVEGEGLVMRRRDLSRRPEGTDGRANACRAGKLSESGFVTHWRAEEMPEEPLESSGRAIRGEAVEVMKEEN